MSESSEQAKYHKYIWNAYPKTRWLCYHIPNEGQRRNNSQLIAMGLVPGTPDHHHNFPANGFNSLYIEFKLPGESLSEAQKKSHAALRKNNHRVEIAYTFNEALNFFLDYAKGTTYLQK